MDHLLPTQKVHLERKKERKKGKKKESVICKI
jgi:hypothetical protein